MTSRYLIVFVVFSLLIPPFTVTAQSRAVSEPSRIDEPSAAYMLGPEDSLSIKVLNAEEIGAAPYPIDLRGNIRVPLVGVVHAAGLTINQLQADLTPRFQEFLRTPDITISVIEYRSQPISVLGAVANPGVHQIRGRKTLFEVISEAGGLKSEAGNVIKITRRKELGDVPLPGATSDPTQQYSVGEVSIRSVMEAQNPAQNITVKPYDVITVPKADLIYVVGEVRRPGGFPLSEKPTISILEALSLAEGLQRNASPRKAKILRASAGSTTRSEIPVDLNKLLNGQKLDMAMEPNDILFIPNSAAKTASGRAVEAMIQIGTGIMIYSHF